MKKQFAILLAMVLASFGVVALASPAHAEDGQFSRSATVAYDGTGPNVIRRKETRVQIRWDRQGDGTGVQLEFLDVDTTDGCSLLPEPEYTKTGARYYTDGGTHYKSWDWGIENTCSWTKNFDSINGSDKGKMRIRVGMCGGNDWLWWVFELEPDGGSTVLDKGHNDCGPEDGID